MATKIKMILILNLLWSEFVEMMSDVSICFYRSSLSVLKVNLSVIIILVCALLPVVRGRKIGRHDRPRYNNSRFAL